MNPNIFAFLQKGTRTVQVSFQGYEKTHTYLTTDDRVQVGSYVVVRYKPKDGPERFSIAQVKSADDFLNLQVDDHTEYGWVVSLVSMADDMARISREATVLEMLEDAKRKAAAKKLTSEVLENLPERHSAIVKQLTGHDPVIDRT